MGTARFETMTPLRLDSTTNTSEALSSFFKDLMVQSGRQARHISIISDNAKRTTLHYPEMSPTTRRRRTPGRSVSTPLNHMSSRWDTACSLNTQPTNRESRRTGDGTGNKSRWDCGSSLTDNKRGAIVTPRRKSSTTEDVDGLKPAHDIGKLRSRGSNGKSAKKEATTASMPKSLRSLPY
eukprot:Nitzschia sp. Nitz4//scaffold75_size92586//73887//74426//NITZ4_004867-RA/size92586-processed-gene-0.27-mRNA-1//1//CDS//3329557741//2232//frame0